MNSSSQRSLPYPDTDGIIRNPSFLNEIASSRLYELGDISDYIYFSLLLKDCYPAVSELFEKLAMTEMRHFSLLGRMTLRLGGDPALRVRHSNPYYGSRSECVDGQTVKRILSAALEGEQLAVKRYMKLADVMSADKAASALLERIAADEEHHARMLSRALGET